MVLLSELIEKELPKSCFCCLSHQVLRDPVMDRQEGHCYERSMILEWISRNGTCPMTRNPLSESDLVPNRRLMETIEELIAKIIDSNPDVEDDYHIDNNNTNTNINTTSDSNSKVSDYDDNINIPSAPPFIDNHQNNNLTSQNTNNNDIVDDVINELNAAGIDIQSPYDSQNSQTCSMINQPNAVQIIAFENGKKFLVDKNMIENILRPQDPITSGELKEGHGTTVRMKNKRTNTTIGCVLKVMDNDRLKLQGWSNPLEHAHDHTWQNGDTLELIDYAYDNMYHQVPFKIDHCTSTGWNIHKEAIRVGKSGIVGDWWKELTVVLDLVVPLDLLEHGLYIWCDCVKFDIMNPNYDNDNLEYKRDSFIDNLWFVNRNFTTDNSNIGLEEITQLHLLFPSTDLHQSESLSTFRDGGGVHIELFTPIV